MDIANTDRIDLLTEDGITIKERIEGVKDCFNDILLHHRKYIKQHIIFFPGDVQDYVENMTKHRDNYRWKEYSLENTIRILSSKFPTSCIWIVRCSKMHLGTFSCYENFLKTNMFGVPDYNEKELKASAHLTKLFNTMIKKVRINEETENVLENLPIKLIGFSKGCVVLNQLVYELPLIAMAEQKSEVKKFFKQILSFVWLDSGNCGNSGAWVTDKNKLEVLSNFIPEVQVHVTPYQMKDQSRPWIRKEQRIFIGCLRKHKCNLKELQYFEERLGGLDDHFELLKIAIIE